MTSHIAEHSRKYAPAYLESIAKPTTRPASRNFREDKCVTEFDGSSRYKAMHQNNNIGVSVEITALPRETAGINAHNTAAILAILPALGLSSYNR